MNRNLSDEAKAKNTQLVKHIEDCATFDSSSDEESGDEMDADQAEHLLATKIYGIDNPKQSPAPKTHYRHITHLNTRNFRTKMINIEQYREQVSKLQSIETRTTEIASIAKDSADEHEHKCTDDDEDVKFVINPLPTDTQVNMDQALDDIRQKAVEHDRQQLKGIHLANAGDGNLKVVNSYTVTSSTCILI